MKNSNDTIGNRTRDLPTCITNIYTITNDSVMLKTSYVTHLILRLSSNQSFAACLLRTTDLWVQVQFLTTGSSEPLQTNAQISPPFRATNNN